MITFDFPTCVAGDTAEVQATSTSIVKLVALALPFNRRDLHGKVIISGVSVVKSGEGLLFRVQVRNISDEYLAVKLNGLEESEVKRDSETGSINSCLERDGTWSVQ